MRYIITIDQRTSSSKALLFDEKLNLIDHKIIPHKISHPREDWVEADAEEIYRNTVAAIKPRIRTPTHSRFLASAQRLAMPSDSVT